METNDKKNLLIELHYLPCLDYFKLFLEADQIILEAHEHFTKQTYRNRCYILGANGKLALTVPVEGGSQKTKITEVKIDFSSDWNRQHWQSIKSAYGKSAFFMHYADFLEPLYQNPPALLWEWNLKLLTICQKLLAVKKEVLATENFDIDPKNEILDKRNQIHPKKPAIFTHSTYYQLFGDEFENNLSILDLLFNEGRNAKHLLQQ